MIGIYKITNLINGKCYIGQSIDIKTRWNHHKWDHKPHSHYPLYRAFDKYGIENFSFEILEECSIEELDQKEIEYIQQYDSYNNGYNQTTGGSGGSRNFCLKLSIEDVNIIYDLLMNSDVPQKDIAKEFNVGEDTISEINQGKTRVNPNLVYPLRQNIFYHGDTFCIDCGKKITRGYERCRACADKHRIIPLDQMEVSRDELKSLIRTTPFVQIGKMFHVTDNAVRKWCDKFELPRKVSDIKTYSDEEWAKI